MGLGEREGIDLSLSLYLSMGFPGGLDSKESACSVGDLDSILGWEDLLEEGTAIHSSILAWTESSWTEEPSRLQSMGLQRVRHD